MVLSIIIWVLLTIGVIKLAVWLMDRPSNGAVLNLWPIGSLVLIMVHIAFSIGYWLS